ncbi:TetR/AcrR family transcriptional regulator [Pantanalinema rosaneae CENA516]|uniref:TetR/AcrR family transcriptional regulator n=1 Tax=Pantanalinema rosaneae TaxID=1620701 RepID=UPI003D6F5F2C
MAELNASASAIAAFSATPQYTPKQEAILRGAVQVFLQSGYAGTSMDRVAAEAGVSKQTIYSHFQDKEGLFTALMERMTIRRFQAILSIDQLHGEPKLLLRQFAEGFLNHIVDEEYVALLRLIIAESVRFPELAKLYGRTVIQKGRQLMTEFFQQHPELGFTDAEAVAHIFIGSLVSYVLAQEIFYGKERFPLERDRLIATLLALIIKQV